MSEVVLRLFVKLEQLHKKKKCRCQVHIIWDNNKAKTVKTFQRLSGKDKANQNQRTFHQSGKPFQILIWEQFFQLFGSSPVIGEKVSNSSHLATSPSIFLSPQHVYKYMLKNNSLTSSPNFFFIHMSLIFFSLQSKATYFYSKLMNNDLHLFWPTDTEKNTLCLLFQSLCGSTFRPSDQVPGCFQLINLLNFFLIFFLSILFRLCNTTPFKKTERPEKTHSSGNTTPTTSSQTQNSTVYSASNLTSLVVAKDILPLGSQDNQLIYRIKSISYSTSNQDKNPQEANLTINKLKEEVLCLCDDGLIIAQKYLTQQNLEKSNSKWRGSMAK
ncbi:hypothetical protein VP01_67g3 [Puccinia sorghi]|uniref:Uncharacterized protein n=1 Tax=Puccinia sorghi TaxID=27349 RepID=A0A0L6UFD5_9BASI|nr:hypothetical protein VP01_67g3 [Puccinia sorghi]